MAQQALKDSRTEEVLGWHFSLHRGAPRVVILPETEDDREERMALAQALRKLRCNVYVPAMPTAFSIFIPLCCPALAGRAIMD